MLFDEISFHDAGILEVREDCLTQLLSFVLDMPIDWENNVFEKRLLCFTNAIFYLRTEIPFQGSPSILQINTVSPGEHIYKLGPGVAKSANYKVEINTNAGTRIIEFDDAQLLPA
ncbi:MAG TPA: hypothetical protein VG738_03435 [Chitinophagaceae bacterium]|nr:hypothetical protein [Chitinophagaceae bacterium]